MYYVVGAFCFIVGMAVGCGAMDYQHHTSDNREKVKECQKDLPRSQKCELVAIPQIGDKK